MKYFYLVHFQYLGFRYHGYAVQPEVKTVQKMIERTLSFVLGDLRFKTLVSSRTDAMVSANYSIFELFMDEAIDTEWLFEEFNKNIPPDIRVLKIEEVDDKFNVIQHPKAKEYVYLFSFGAKPHPFSASLIAHFCEDFDLELMKKGAALFLGEHNFKNYTKAPKENANFIREITCSHIEENNLFTANFFPEKTYVYHIHSKGFMRNQIRYMFGQLINLALGEVDLEGIQKSLESYSESFEKRLAPASGLILNKIKFED